MKVSLWKKVSHANGYRKKAGTAVFTSEEKKTLDFRRQTLDVEIYSLYKPLIINKTISF